MKIGWQRKAVGEVCDVVNGGTPKTGIPEYWSGKNLWITPAEMGKRLSPYVDDTERKISDFGLRDSSARMLPPYSVILSSRAPIGHLVLNTKPMSTNQGCKGLIPDKRLGHKFLYYYLTSIVDFLESLGTGTTFKELSGGKLKEVPVPVPPLPEQQRIVGLLDNAFAGIATAKANAEKNLQNARALFQGHLQSVFVRSGDEVRLSELATDITDGDHMPPPKAPSGVPFVTISNIVKRTREIDFTDTFTVPKEYFENLKPYKKPRRGDILYTVTGATLGIPVLVRQEIDFCFQRHIGLIRPKPGTDSEWLNYALLSPQVFRQATVGSTGAAQKTVSLTVLRNISVPKVRFSEQKKIAEKIVAVETGTQRLEVLYEQKLAALEALKKSLLHRAFTGQL